MSGLVTAVTFERRPCAGNTVAALFTGATALRAAERDLNRYSTAMPESGFAKSGVDGESIPRRFRVPALVVLWRKVGIRESRFLASRWMSRGKTDRPKPVETLTPCTLLDFWSRSGEQYQQTTESACCRSAHSSWRRTFGQYRTRRGGKLTLALHRRYADLTTLGNDFPAQDVAVPSRLV